MSLYTQGVRGIQLAQEAKEGDQCPARDTGTLVLARDRAGIYLECSVHPKNHWRLTNEDEVAEYKSRGEGGGEGGE